MTVTVAEKITPELTARVEQARKVTDAIPDSLKTHIRVRYAALLLMGATPPEAVRDIAEAEAQDCRDRGYGEGVAKAAYAGVVMLCLVDTYDAVKRLPAQS